jgi:valyl-tRNA synthetase
VRPATMLADVAVAVHPDDERYRDLVGREVLVPVVERRVPIIADELVDPEFGTGALKVTPGHDPTDFEIGRDHSLPEVTVIGFDGRMTGDIPPEYVGLTEDEAGERVVSWLREHGRLEKRESYRHSVGHCERSGTRIQPLVSLQWWCDMETMAKPAIESIESGRVSFHPPVHGRVALDWLKAIRPWNVSRQLWWGHQLPIWYCENGHVTCAESEPGACVECGSIELERDPDVLDTWFSSALWPFATLGWPDDTPELRRYYPGDVNSTAREIIFLWVNRMIMSGLELVGDIPFHDVVIHSIILDPDGRRMSKSKGTGIDPVELIDAHGADATRYGLLKMSSTQDVRFTTVPIEEGRRLANKLWNASRLLLLAGADDVDARPSSLEERWILARIEATRLDMDKDLDTYEFAHAVDRLYHLTFDDFCDWYLESIKPRLGEPEVKATAFAALERLLKLLHPVMPHVTEEIWSHLPARSSRLIVAPWPEADASYAGTEDTLVRVQEAAERFRRSGVVTPLEGDERRIFEAVVRPERARHDGAKLGDEVARLEKEIARAEGMLSNESFTARAPADVVEAEREKLERFRRELDAIRNSVDRVARPVANRGLRGRANARASRCARRSADTLPRGARRRDERQVDHDAVDRGAARRRGALRRRVSLAARTRLERANPDRWGGGGLRACRGERATARRRARRDAVRSADRRSAACVREGRGRRCGRGGGARRSPRCDERAAHACRRADERCARPHGRAR